MNEVVASPFAGAQIAARPVGLMLGLELSRDLESGARGFGERVRRLFRRR